MINLPNSTPRSNKLHSSLYRVIFSRYALGPLAPRLNRTVRVIMRYFHAYRDASFFLFFFTFPFFFFFFFFFVFRDGDKNSGLLNFFLSIWENIRSSYYFLNEVGFYIESFSKEKWVNELHITCKYKLYQFYCSRKN